MAQENALKGVRGYKVFNPDWTCRGFQYEVGKTYEEDIEPSCYNRGFRFCEKASDCFNYYDFNSNNKVAEVVALGDVVANGDESCTNKIQIVREIPWMELLTIVNTGKNCTGKCNTGNCNTGNWNTGNWNTGNRNTGNCNTGDCNTGNCNTGDWNTGNRNTGDWNTGNRNTGNCNTGNCNTGNRNTGNCNTGNWNTGNRNTGNCNTGDCNTGNCNTGNCNTGDWNTGNRNTGDWNTGNRNTGNCNTGDCNTGNCNTGDWNTGNRNTGDWNSCNQSTGCFCTKTQPIVLFDKPSDWQLEDWVYSDAKKLMDQIPKDVVEWICEEDMTDEEKIAHPTYKTTGGYLKVLDMSECGQIWWDGLSDSDKDVIRSIPNFDANIFEQITGIKTM